MVYISIVQADLSDFSEVPLHDISWQNNWLCKSLCIAKTTYAFNVTHCYCRRNWLDFPIRECPLWSTTCGLVGMWRILLKNCWSAPDWHDTDGGVDRHSTWKLSFLRWGGRGGEGRGGGVDRHSTWKLSFLRWGGRGGEGRGGGLIDTQLGKDPQRLWKDNLWQCWSWMGGSIDTQLGKDPQRL